MKLVSIGLLAIAVQACVSDDPQASPDPSQGRSPGRMMLEQGAAYDAVDSAPRAPVITWGELGQGRMIMAEGGAVMHKAMPSQTSGEVAARLHLMRYRDELGLSPETIEAAELQAAHELRAGASIYQFAQRAGDLPVFQARAKVVLDGARNLVSLANGLVPSAIADAPTGNFTLQPEAALAKAYLAAGGPELLLSGIVEQHARRPEWRKYALQTPAGVLGVLESSARQVMFLEHDRLVAAYHIELMTQLPQTRENRLYRVLIAGDDGRVLMKTLLTASETFTYRVFAEPDGNHAPLDGPIADSTPHPTGVPEVFAPAFAEPVLVQMEGFNKHGDPWLEDSATYTFGNNVEAYSDRNQANSFFSTSGGFTEGSDYRAEVTAPKTFDRVYDPTQVPDVSPEQIMASVTQVFYVTNWLHDFFYDSGFDEASGNGQVDNLGRGGMDGDPLLAEAQDSADNGTANNANMSTPSDGASPRMQMYVWTGSPNRKFVTEPAVHIEDWLGGASFGPSMFELPPTELVLSDDDDTSRPFLATGTGAGSVTDACQQPNNVSGKVAVIDRGVCAFTDKVQNAQEAGAVAALVINNSPGHSAPNAATNAMQITIPTLMLSFEDGQRLKSQMLEGTVRTTTFSRGPEVRRDGSIDNTVVAHEWGHFIHMRLVDGQSQQFGAMSEGWGDFLGLFLTIREGDEFAGRAYPLSQYAAGGFDARAAYFGIRRAPYSVEYTINPFTFQNISARAETPDWAPLSAAGGDAPNNEVHAAGEIWAQVMFEVYVNILESGKAAGRPFADNQRRMADYVVAGMKAAPDNPTFLEQRDGILSAARAMAAMDPTRASDVDAIARGFAKRGMGKDAEAPPASSSSLNEVVESYEIAKD
jgi:hypothetical protein